MIRQLGDRLLNKHLLAACRGWSNSIVLPTFIAAAIACGLAFGLQPEASGLGVWYKEFAREIQGGLAVLSSREPQTFPMWGYGILITLVPSTPALVVLQIALALASTVWLLLSLVFGGRITHRAAAIGMWTIALFLPWHAMLATAYSAPAIATSLMALSTGLLVRYLANNSSKQLLLVGAAIAFGLGLNVRSDYFAFSFVVAVIIYFAASTSRLGAVGASIWIITCAMTITPWMIYTYHVTGRPLITSTNTGHVLFLSWGDLPENRWGIHINDSDPVMLRELQEGLGRPVGSLSAEGDRFLRKRFFEMLSEEPFDYLKRTVLHVRNLILGGFFPGNWDPEFRTRVRERFPHENLNLVLVRNWRNVVCLTTPRTTLTVLAELQGRLGLVLCVFMATFATCRAVSLRDWVMLLFSAGIFYQLAVSAAAHYLRPPLNNQIVPFVCLSLWWRAREKQQLISDEHNQ